MKTRICAHGFVTRRHNTSSIPPPRSSPCAQLRVFTRSVNLFGALALPLFLLLIACDDRSHRDIGDEINILTRRDDALVGPATLRLSAYGRRAIPQIETALHTAAGTGRLHLLEALATIGDDEAVPVLRQVAVYDVKLEVRQAAEAILARWAETGPPPLRARATAAVAEIARKRAAGEGPVLWGDAGAPGVAPTTVGAPAPVGAALEKRR